MLSWSCECCDKCQLRRRASRATYPPCSVMTLSQLIRWVMTSSCESMWVNVSDLPVTCVLLPLMTTIRQAEPENPLWHSWKSHCDQSSPEVERDSGLAKEIVRELSREKKEFSIRKRTKIYKHISHMICNHKIVQTFFPCFYNWKHVCRGFLLKFETLSCEVSQLPDSQQVELEVRGIKADVKEMTIDRDKYTFNIMISTTRIRIVGT